jgi:hypothetical protein
VTATAHPSDPEELSKALMVYLGGGSGRGILPYGQKERLVTAFPEKADALLSECVRIVALLDCDPKVRQTGDLVQIGRSVSERIRKKVVWLDEAVADKLGDYYSYQMR